MSSKDYPNDNRGSSVILERLEELHEELNALVRGNSVDTRYTDGGGFADLRGELERLHYMVEASARSAEMPMNVRPRAAASAEAPSPPYSPYPPYPPYPPVAPFPPYPPYPPNCGCCAPAPCGCPKCSGHTAPASMPAPEPTPAPPAVVPSSSSSSSSSNIGEIRGRTFGVRLPSSSSSSQYAQNLR